MDIKATKLQNTQQTTSSTTVQTPTKTADGKSFIDEMISLPELDNKNTEVATKTATANNAKETTAQNKPELRDFEFVSTQENSFAKTLNNNAKSTHQLKQAEKELVNECVLMNEKTSKVKDSKSELKTAQASVSQKSDKEIETENNDKALVDYKQPDFNQNNNAQDFENRDKNNLPQISKNAEPDFTNKQIENTDKNIQNLTNFDKNDTKNEIFENNIKIADKLDPVQELKPIENLAQKDLSKGNLEKTSIINAPKDTKDSVLPIIFENNIKIADKLDPVQELKPIENLAQKDLSKGNLEKTSIINAPKDTKDSVLPISKADKAVMDVVDVDPAQAINNSKAKEMQNMEVIVIEPIKPVLEVSNSITNNNKTSDIVKFIDANLSTESSSKTTKTKSTSSSASAEKKAQKSIKMTEADANFFNNLVENNQQTADTKTVDSSNNMTLKDIEESHSAEVSKTLLNALKESRENNKAFRVDFDKDLSVILKVNKDGQISAEFLPGDKAVEQYLKANIPLLKQQFDDEGLSYENLSYRQHKKENEEEKRNNRGNKKENGYE